MKNEERVVIAGGGLAGLRAGERLRELGFRGEIVIVSAERHLPYHRPALSKEAINGELVASDLRLTISRELNAVWRLGTAATHLEPDRHVVGLPGGEELRYDGLVIATGVEPRHLAGAPRQDPRIHVLRTVDDAIAIKRAINATQGLVVVIGGGLIGCEMAASVKTMGRDVAIVSRSSTLLGSAVGKNIADTVTEAHRVRGVRMAMGVKIRHWVRQAGGVAIHLSDGQVFFAAVVVIAVGASPSVAWLRGSGLVLEDGVLCDPTCHVVGGTDVVAAGDVARWPNLRFGGQPRRVEHWLNAVEMGRAAAENLLAGRDSSRPFTPVPRFWTEQYGMRIQGSGLPAMGKDTTTLAGSQKDHRTITGFIDDGRLVGMVGLDAPTAMIKLSTELWRQNRVTGTGPYRRPRQQPTPREAALDDSARSDAARRNTALPSALPAPAAEPAAEPVPEPAGIRGGVGIRVAPVAVTARAEESVRFEAPRPRPARAAGSRDDAAGSAGSRNWPGRSASVREIPPGTGVSSGDAVGSAGLQDGVQEVGSQRARAQPTRSEQSLRFAAVRSEALRLENALLQEAVRIEAARADSARSDSARSYAARAESPGAGWARFADPVEPARVPRQQQESQPLPLPPSHAPVVRSRGQGRSPARTGPRARPR
ncbi:NADPH-dependent 2,4-dienoyl-CoA reductase/sulfur reductase-like enzyme [Saccharothrix saharensis]|uniref:NADPH-dependent 2,4-dienoyl-CoA reductase/sulfur reductase-like enzyme n=1 Tax=Saccharothrix saharensis TaxID=571190 RepID=A0A543J831_9PSEU|nr:FAD-dependent oxidoreductase [Saccharothrix saharensis]TQM78968.1 NADPH-dependent 2,4-dienoyl-CoA reductase/sulfur reductase-like enzyme [Saccharothrix saharensis]